MIAKRIQSVRRRHTALVVLISVVLGLGIYIVLPNSPGFPVTIGTRHLADLDFRRGLDLQGGLHVRFAADPGPDQVVDADTMEAVRQIIENRVNGLGVAEPVIQIEGDNRLIVELPGLGSSDSTCPTDEAACEDPLDAAIELFRETGQLLVVDTGMEPQREGEKFVADPENVVLRGADLETARVEFDPVGSSYIAFELKSSSGEHFERHTQTHLGQWLTITVDDIVISSAIVEAAIRDKGVIRGSFTPDQAKRLAIQLQYGALPVPLKVVENLTVRPTLGQESLALSVRAGILGASLVLGFMVLYYRALGMVAALALIAYVVTVFAIFKLVPVTLTLAGLAGFILSVGVAVDANILIFERTREEVRQGRSVHRAIEVGFNRAWPSIRDSNISTLLICGVLFAFSSGGVRGFALTLAIGIAVSMFSAITVSRTLLRLGVLIPGFDQPRWLGVHAKPDEPPV